MGRWAWAGWVLVATLVTGCGGAAATAAAGAASPSTTSTPSPTGAPSPTSADAPTLTAADLRSAPVPALCKHSAGRLKNGRLPGVPSRHGSVELHYTKSVAAPGPVRVALTADGVEELAAVIDCNQGGVAWPQIVIVYRPGPEILGWLDLADVAHAEHSTVEGLTAAGRTMRVAFVSTDGCCFNERHQAATVGWDGSHLGVRALSTRWVAQKGACSVADLETAWSGRDQNCLEPEVLGHLFYPGSPFTPDSAGAYLQNVVFIQLRLRDLKYDVVVDGHYGPRTAAVVRTYQQDKGLIVDGETGLQTWESLFGLGGTY